MTDKLFDAILSQGGLLSLLEALALIALWVKYNALTARFIDISDGAARAAIATTAALTSMEQTLRLTAEDRRAREERLDKITLALERNGNLLAVLEDRLEPRRPA